MHTARPKTLSLFDAATTPISPYWSPLAPTLTPQEYVRCLLDDVMAYHYHGSNGGLAELNPATTAGGLAASGSLNTPVVPQAPSMDQYQQYQQQSHQYQQQQRPPQAIQQHQSSSVGQSMAPAAPNHHHHQQQQQLQLAPPPTPANNQQQQHQQHPNQQQSPPQVSSAINDSTPKQPLANNQQDQFKDQQQQQPYTDTDASFVESKPRVRLSDEERLRHKRERNRRAAANCRRRKDEKLRSLEEENAELRKTIDNLQASVVSLQEQLHRVKLETSSPNLS